MSTAVSRSSRRLPSAVAADLEDRARAARRAVRASRSRRPPTSARRAACQRTRRGTGSVSACIAAISRDDVLEPDVTPSASAPCQRKVSSRQTIVVISARTVSASAPASTSSHWERAPGQLRVQHVARIRARRPAPPACVRTRRARPRRGTRPLVGRGARGQGTEVDALRRQQRSGGRQERVVDVSIEHDHSPP